ncbi:hypothetical protein [Streptomyces sp. H27-H5]|uniref:hypothetical protein n=1 Tax=Streptomyces sp. H27-H5 TaxID=2996460 RepID=UPI00226D9D13|nr:hypothetical protein [Streptomyces sp. H27-H5]MCY0962615.1 hypothetical protein [Streptomyces sp. H27-H5]
MSSAQTRIFVAEIADSFRGQAESVGAQSRSDWRLATVASVGGSGTVTMSDGTVARRMEDYVNPEIGDLVVISWSSTGQILCHGRLGAGDGSGWTTYVPTWSTTGTAPALGNGVLSGQYTLRGDECHVSIRMIAGSTTTYGTGQYRWALPFTAATLANANFAWTGSTIATDAAAAYYSGSSRIQSAAQHVMCLSPAVATGGTTGEWNSARPFTWGNGDYMSLDITYQIA